MERRLHNHPYQTVRDNAPNDYANGIRTYFFREIRVDKSENPAPTSSTIKIGRLSSRRHAICVIYCMPKRSPTATILWNSNSTSDGLLCYRSDSMSSRPELLVNDLGDYLVAARKRTTHRGPTKSDPTKVIQGTFTGSFSSAAALARDLLDTWRPLRDASKAFSTTSRHCTFSCLTLRLQPRNWSISGLRAKRVARKDYDMWRRSAPTSRSI